VNSPKKYIKKLCKKKFLDSTTQKRFWIPPSFGCKKLNKTSYKDTSNLPPHIVKVNFTLASKPTYCQSLRRIAPFWNIKMSFLLKLLLNYMKEATLEATEA
jgi:hypothetical protein